MRLAIDASNICAGGGLTHLRCLLDEAVPAAHNIEQVLVYGSDATLRQLPERPWLEKIRTPLLERSLPWRVFWQQFVLPRVLFQRDCQVLFSPGGTLPFRRSIPAIALSQNLLPFEYEEASRFGVGQPMWLKLMLLRIAQGWSIGHANGVVFLTDYAKARIIKVVGRLSGRSVVVPHGVEKRFREAPRPQMPSSSFSEARPFRFLYVSIIDAYKHQVNVATAVGALRRKGLWVGVDFVGPSRERFLKQLLVVAAREDSSGRFIRWLGACPYDALPGVYSAADGFVFASTCENLPNILLEAMAAGLPIACSQCGPMPEVLDNAGVYFDPDSIESIMSALQKLYFDRGLREVVASRAHNKALAYSWKRCADRTLAFIAGAAVA